MFKLYKDTEIVINEEENKIILLRGYWNFNQVTIDLSNEKNKEHIIEIFRELDSIGEIKEKLINDDFYNSFLQLVKSGLIFQSNTDNIEKRNILFITDDINYINRKIEYCQYSKNIHIIEKKILYRHFFGNNSFLI